MQNLVYFLLIGGLVVLVLRQMGFAIPFVDDGESDMSPWQRMRFSKAQFEQCRMFFEGHRFSYYHQLDTQNRKKFIARTLLILGEKKFIEEEHFRIDFEHRIVLAATLAQLTFGIDESHFMLPRFRYIHIFPKTFFSKILNHQVKGLTVGNGHIFLSWEDFRSGYENGSDKVNLGLHEFAHALEMELKHAEDSDFNMWQFHAQKVMVEFQQGRFGSFRSYASTNIHELWATTVETFFEAPHHFKRDHAALYAATVRVLNQDPTEHTLASI